MTFISEVVTLYVVGVIILLFWALATLSTLHNAMYGVWVTHGTSLGARRHRSTKFGVGLSEPLQQRWPLVVSYSVRFVLVAVSTVLWILALDWLL